MSQSNYSQSVSSQTEMCQTSEDRAFIATYINSARMKLQEIGPKEQCKDEKKKSKSRKSNGTGRNGGAKRGTDGNQDLGDDGGKSQPLSVDDLSSLATKKRKRDFECISLSVSESDLDNYGTSDDDFMLDETKNATQILLDFSSGSSSSSSPSVSDSSLFNSLPSSLQSKASGGSCSSGNFEVIFEEIKQTESSNVKAKVYSDYKENNKNGKKLVEVPSDESDDEITDDGSEEHVVCFICGKYNRRKKFYRWISCTICKNWFHKDCTHLWRKKNKDFEKSDFICRYH